MVELTKKDIITTLKIVSNMLRFLGLIILVPMFVSIAYKEYVFSKLFLIMAVLLFVVFSVINRFLKGEKSSIKDAIIGMVFCWIIISFISSIPFLIIKMRFVDALFEAVSGWTGTGLTMVQTPEQLPFSINFWRAFIQWVGGFGIVILALMFYEKPKTAKVLFLAEGRTENFFINFSVIARTIVGIYFFYTVMGVLLMMIAGVPFFDALVNVMTAIATGGFTTRTAGVGIFGPIAMCIMILMMLIGGISFASHYELLKGKIKNFFSNPEIRLMLLMILGAAAVIAFDLFLTKQYKFFDGLFYSVSALSGTGHTAILSVDKFPHVSIVILVLLMISGACYGSTTGAIKIWRTAIVGKVIKREISRVFFPERTILPIKLGGNVIPEENASKAAAYMLLYISILLLGSISFIFFGYDTIHSIFTVASAQGNVGLNILTERYFSMNAFLKVQLMLHMLLGRLEIIPIFVLIRGLVGGRTD